MIIWGRLISAREIEIKIQHPFIQICIIPEKKKKQNIRIGILGKKRSREHNKILL